MPSNFSSSSLILADYGRVNKYKKRRDDRKYLNTSRVLWPVAHFLETGPAHTTLTNCESGFKSTAEAEESVEEYSREFRFILKNVIIIIL